MSTESKDCIFSRSGGVRPEIVAFKSIPVFIVSIGKCYANNPLVSTAGEDARDTSQIGKQMTVVRLLPKNMAASCCTEIYCGANPSECIGVTEH